jgi:tRNA G46 methylase TrmB
MTLARPVGLTVKQHAPRADRSKGPIVDVLRRVLPSTGIALEIGSGTGQHVVHFARTFPTLEWQPSDYDQVAVASVDGYRREAGVPNLRECLPRIVGCRARHPPHPRHVMVCL